MIEHLTSILPPELGRTPSDPRIERIDKFPKEDSGDFKIDKPGRIEVPRVDPDSPRKHDIPFKGLQHVEGIADLQYGGTCWAEALENVIQLVRGDIQGVYNNLSTDIITEVFNNPKKWKATKYLDKKACERWNISYDLYADMLERYGVDAQTQHFSHDALQAALKDHRPVILSGECHNLGERYADNKGLHALVVLEWQPDTEKYLLLDSNFKEPYTVSKEMLGRFVRGSFDDMITEFFHPRMTVVKSPCGWPSWRDYVNGKWQANA